jgi:hypothetical protein
LYVLVDDLLVNAIAYVQPLLYVRVNVEDTVELRQVGFLTAFDTELIVGAEFLVVRLNVLVIASAPLVVPLTVTTWLALAKQAVLTGTLPPVVPLIVSVVQDSLPKA